jgi:hypothetical protein
MLRPTGSRPVCLGVKNPSGAYYQIFITVRHLRVCWCGVLSLTRERVCHLQLLLVLASAVMLGSESAGLVTIFYCLSFETLPTWRARSPTTNPQSQKRLAVYRQSVCLGIKPLETHDQKCLFSQLNGCDISPYVTSSLTRSQPWLIVPAYNISTGTAGKIPFLCCAIVAFVSLGVLTWSLLSNCPAMTTVCRVTS